MSNLQKRIVHYVLAMLGIVVVTAVLLSFHPHINSTTVALLLLLVVLFAATLWGSRPALLAALLGVGCLNFFFLPPLGAFTVADPENWVALAVFFITAITAGQLSARAGRRAEEAETGKREIGRLYRELQNAFERASHTEALRQSEKLKSALLDAVTHDLRTPLASIKASITTLLGEAQGVTTEREQVFALDAEARRDMLEVINEESDRLNNFIGGLIELARIEAGELHLHRRWGTVDEIVAAALSRAETLTHRHRIAVELEAELPIVRVDPRAVSEVIYTLVDNAAKYSPPDTSIRLNARHATGDNALQLFVEDAGQGVPVDLRERVFDKFFRATRDGDTGTHHPAGTGMGLAIARGIVEAHGGRIWIEDGAGERGTRVVFTLLIGDDEDAGIEPGAETVSHESAR